MAESFLEIAERMGGRVVGKVPHVRGGAFGMVRVANIIHDQITPAQETPPKQPAAYVRDEVCKVPVSNVTQAALEEMARIASTPERPVSAVCVAAQLLEEAVARAKAAR